MRHITVYEITVYEDLIDYEKGPKETVDLISFVHRVTNVPLFMQPSQIPCIWSKVLQLKTIPYLYLSILKGNDSNPILVQNVHGTCIDATPKYEKGIIPIFQASFPGSGSEMMRDLIEAITEFKTADGGKRRNDVVAIKTLYPYRNLDLKPGYLNRDMKHLVLLIRYPLLNAISSNFAHIYWAENNIPPHRMQPPKKEWVKWRDKNIKREIDAWIDNFMFWVDSFIPSNNNNNSMTNS